MTPIIYLFAAAYLILPIVYIAARHSVFSDPEDRSVPPSAELDPGWDRVPLPPANIQQCLRLNPHFLL